MAPASTIDSALGLSSHSVKPVQPASSLRTLLLSPPSLSSHPERLDSVLAARDRSATDIQMLDRLALSLVSLPDSLYDTILVLLDADGTRSESKTLLTKDVLDRMVKALKPGGNIQSQDGSFAAGDETERRAAILAGLIVDGTTIEKPSYHTTASMPLRVGKRNDARASTNATGTGAVTLNINGKRKNGPTSTAQPADVGYVGSDGDLEAPGPGNGDSDDELIDEDTLLDEDDIKINIVQREIIYLAPSSCPGPSS